MWPLQWALCCVQGPATGQELPSAARVCECRDCMGRTRLWDIVGVHVCASAFWADAFSVWILCHEVIFLRCFLGLASSLGASMTPVYPPTPTACHALGSMSLMSSRGCGFGGDAVHGARVHPVGSQEVVGETRTESCEGPLTSRGVDLGGPSWSPQDSAFPVCRAPAPALLRTEDLIARKPGLPVPRCATQVCHPAASLASLLP